MRVSSEVGGVCGGLFEHDGLERSVGNLTCIGDKK